MKNLSERIRVFEGIRRDDVLPPDFSSSHEKLGITVFKTQKIASSIYTMIMKNPDLRPTASDVLKSKTFLENEMFDYDEELLTRDAKIASQALEISTLQTQVAELQKKLARKTLEVKRLTNELENQEK